MMYFGRMAEKCELFVPLPYASWPFSFLFFLFSGQLFSFSLFPFFFSFAIALPASLFERPSQLSRGDIAG